MDSTTLLILGLIAYVLSIKWQNYILNKRIQRFRELNHESVVKITESWRNGVELGINLAKQQQFEIDNEKESRFH